MQIKPPLVTPILHEKKQPSLQCTVSAITTNNDNLLSAGHDLKHSTGN